MHPWPASSCTPERNRFVTVIRSQHPSAVQLQEPPEPAQSPGSLSGLELDCSDEPCTLSWGWGIRTTGEGEATGKSLLNIKRRLMKFLLLYIFNLPVLIDQSAIRPSEATRGPGAQRAAGTAAVSTDYTTQTLYGPCFTLYSFNPVHINQN